MDEQMLQLLSNRGRHFVINPNLIYKHVTVIKNQLYDPENNPQGIVNMGVAENFLCEDLLVDRLSKPDMNVLTSTMLRYFQFAGEPSFREAMSKFLTRYFKAAKPLDPNNLIVVSGMGPALDLLATLIADAGDCFLCPAPHYAGLTSDFNGRPQTRLIPVQLPLDGIKPNMDQQKIDEMIQIFDDVYTSAKNKGDNVKGIVLVNPDNPTGHVKPLALISAILNFAKRYELHVIWDEAYALTVHDPETPITSVLQLPEIPDKQRTYMVWGFSKDFNMSGIRCGVIYTDNLTVIQASQQFAYFSAVSPVIQLKLETLVSDYDWLDMFFKTNVSRIRRSYEYCKKTLSELGVPYKEATAAFFIWADFTEFLSEISEAGEMEFFQKLIDHKVFFLPGCIQTSNMYGWFRITVVLPQTYLQQGMVNLAKLVGEERKAK